MAINQWLANGTAVAQVDTYTPGGTIEADDLFILTITGFDGTTEVVSVAAGGTAVADVTAALETAWNSASGDLVESITALDNTTNLTLTADTAGVAFKVTQTTTEAGGGAADAQTFAKASTTPNGGPSDWQDADNWSLGTVPGEDVGGDDSEEVYVTDSTVDILYGLDNTGATFFLKSLHTDMTYTGNIGWDEDAGFIGAYLQVETALLFIGENFDQSTSPGSARTKIDVGSTTASEITVYNTSSRSDTNKPACRLMANHTDTIIRDIRKGTVGFSFLDQEAGRIESAFQSYASASSKASDSQLSIGRGATIDASVEAVGGRTTIKCAVPTVTNKDGTMLTIGSGAITTLNSNGGTVTPASTGTITTTVVRGGICDFTASAEPRTATNLQVASGADLRIDTSVVSVPNGILPLESGRFQYRVSDA